MMINVGVLASNHVVMTAVRGVLASSVDVNVMHLHELGCSGPAIELRGDVDVLLCEPVSSRVLAKVLGKCRQAGGGRDMRVLFLGMPPVERTLKKLIQSGVRGFVGVTVADFAAMPDAIRTVSAGEFYLPATIGMGDHASSGCQ
ncbi:response regulator transcription factor [Pandoraea apista]|uniref:response regulator transcription factor n=1 Tax=Pandoraea apista TaxID=93218 RepID=UPI000F66310F|nr:response regulator transcription factor [Pandoraea apista]RRW96270.1 DNA-binding response regulator [Pandoraea apista]